MFSGLLIFFMLRFTRSNTQIDICNVQFQWCKWSHFPVSTNLYVALKAGVLSYCISFTCNLRIAFFASGSHIIYKRWNLKEAFKLFCHYLITHAFTEVVPKPVLHLLFLWNRTEVFSDLVCQTTNRQKQISTINVFLKVVHICYNPWRVAFLCL